MVAMLPGPPSELAPMLKKYLVPFLQGEDTTVIYSRNIRVFGKGEGVVAEAIAPFLEGENPTAATYAAEGEMYVRVTAKAPSQEEAQRLCAPVVDEICRIVGDAVYGIDVDSLEQVVVEQLLRQEGKRWPRRNPARAGLSPSGLPIFPVLRQCSRWGR